MKKLGSDLSDCGSRVLLTSLTKMQNDHRDDVQFVNSRSKARIPDMLDNINPLYIMKGKKDEVRLIGLTPQFLGEIYSLSDICIFECDGARNLPLKCHKDHDPEVPEFASHVIIVIGTDAINKPLTAGFVHRPELFLRKWRIDKDYILDIDFIAEVLTSPMGYLEQVPHGQRISYYINKSDLDIKSARQLAEKIHAISGCHTFAGSLKYGYCEGVA